MSNEGIVERNEARGRTVTRWMHAGIECAESQQVAAGLPAFHCGYVRLPDALRAHRPKDWDALDVHGGITWPSNCRGCDEGGWIGFDTMHYSSVKIDVRAETCRLAEQIAELAAALGTSCGETGL